jgi:hypothetical protein
MRHTIALAVVAFAIGEHEIVRQICSILRPWNEVIDSTSPDLTIEEQ